MLEKKQYDGVLIVGSRTCNNLEMLQMVAGSVLCNSDPKTIEVISGGARGTDRLAKAFAGRQGMKFKEMPADWDTFGKSAGYRRNARMHEYLSRYDNRLCIIFWDGQSKGTQHNFKMCEDLMTPYVLAVFDNATQCLTGLKEVIPGTKA